jgi:excisionase family DNA binding protein
MTQTEVTVLNPDYWSSEQESLFSLADMLMGPLSGSIERPDGEPPESDHLTLVDPPYWGANREELLEALEEAAGTSSRDEVRHAGTPIRIKPSQSERLTLTVEEAAKLLGISRAFAYESVRRGDIPHIKIGRRLLIPKAKLNELLDSATTGSPENPSSS